MKQSEVIQWLFEQLQDILIGSPHTDITSESEASEHVDIAESDVDHPFPFCGVQPISATPQSHGIQNQSLTVVDTEYVNGILDSITRERETVSRLNIIPVTDNDPFLRDELATSVSDRFTVLQRTDTYPDDIVIQQVGETTPSDRPDEFVRSATVVLVLEYTRTIVDDDPAVAEGVTVDVDVSDDSDFTTVTDAYSEQFTE
jgi:hypothetical protein